MNTPTQNTLDPSHIQKHLDLLQGVINRMANNSASCKTWCITLVAALIAAAYGGDNLNILLVKVALMPILAFGFLDAYYLYLEREFRKNYSGFTKKIRENTYTQQDLFLMKRSENEENEKIGTGIKAVKGALDSFDSVSIWAFYGLQFLAIVLIIWQNCCGTTHCCR